MHIDIEIEKEDPVVILLAFGAGALITYAVGTMLLRRTPAPGSAMNAADDKRLQRKVRSRVDELVSHPRAVEVEVHEGVVRVSGQVLEQERDDLLTQLTAVPGVLRVRNALSVVGDESAFSHASGESSVSAV